MNCSILIGLAVIASRLDGADVPTVRVSGTVQAVHSVQVQVPVTEGKGGNLTLTKLIENGTKVHPGDLPAEFDRTN